MRSIWTGSVSFGLVNVPVKLYGATEDHDIKSHQVHAADGGRIRYKRFCEECDEQVDMADITKAYEHEGNRVILTEDDLATLPDPNSKTIDVVEFVPAGDLDPLMFDKSYYLGPDKGKGAHRAYALLAEALSRTERVGIVKFSMRGKTRLAALKVVGKERVLTVHTLLWPDEIRDPHWITVDQVEVKDSELEMAEKLVEALSNEFNPDRYRDEYQEELRELIAAKADEQPVEVDYEETVAEVDELIRKLEESLARKAVAKK